MLFVDFDVVMGYCIVYYCVIVLLVLEGVCWIDMVEVVRLLVKKYVILIDVMLVEGGVCDILIGVWCFVKFCLSILGVYWFFEFGCGVFDLGIVVWFEVGVVLFRSKVDWWLVILFCFVDCWMSWNVLCCLVKVGYVYVYWYVDGIDGWSESGWLWVDVVLFGGK